VKRVVAIVLIFVISAQCFYQLGMVTYFQLNQQFIADVLCINKEKPALQCHGKCYLKKKLEVTDIPGEAPSPAAGKEKLEIAVYLISRYDLDLRIATAVQDPNFPSADLTPAGFQASLFRPPCAG
jgi:hypothetical protein